MCGMKKEMVNKFFVFFMLTLFAFSFVASVVSAQETQPTSRPTTSAGTQIFGEAVSNFFNNLSNWSTNTFDKPIIVQILLYFLVFLVISSIVSFLPLFVDSQVIRFLVSVSVTILSMILIPAEFLLLVVNPYTALGMTIISVMPFIFMFVFVRAVIRNRFFKNLLWGFFALSLVILGILAQLQSNITPAQRLLTQIYFIAAVFAVVMIVASDWIEDRIFRGAVKAAGSDAEKYLAARKLQIKYDRQRAEAELGLKNNELVGKRALGGG